MKNLVKKVGLGIAALGAAYVLGSQEANAQKYDAKAMDKGAKVISNYRPKQKKDEYVEIKKLANDNVYLIDIDPDKYDDDLDKGALYANPNITIPLTNMGTGKIEYLVSNDGVYVYRKDSIDFLKPKENCTESYKKFLQLVNSNADIKKIDLEGLFTPQKIFYLGDGTPLIAVEVETKKLNEGGKMNHYAYNPLTNFITPDGTIYGEFYRAVKEPGKVIVNAQTGEIVQKADSTGKSDFTTKDLPKSKEPSRLSSQFGIEGAVGADREVTAGAFLNAPIANFVRVGGYGNYSVLSGNSYVSKQPVTTSQNETTLVGPGTYKNTLEEITSSYSDKGIAEVAGEISFVPAKFVEFAFSAGTKVSERTETKDASKTISFERNGVPLGTPETGTNSTAEKSFVFPMMYTGGVRFNLGKHVHLGVEYKRVADQNIGEVNLRANF